jgi:hypothetical protein
MLGSLAKSRAARSVERPRTSVIEAGSARLQMGGLGAFPQLDRDWVIPKEHEGAVRSEDEAVSEGVRGAKLHDDGAGIDELVLADALDSPGARVVTRALT